MKVSNFKTAELEEFYNSGETVFLNYRRVFDLCFSVNSGFFFVERKGYYTSKGLPYTKRGKFVAWKESWFQSFLGRQSA